MCTGKCQIIKGVVDRINGIRVERVIQNNNLEIMVNVLTENLEICRRIEKYSIMFKLKLYKKTEIAKTLAVILALLMACSSFAQRSNRVCIEGIYYDKLANGQIAVAKFYNASSVIIGDSVKSLGKITVIGHEAAMFVSGVSLIDLPESISFIDDMAFTDCASLKCFIMRAVVPPRIGCHVFERTNIRQCVLYVPDGSVQKYKSDAVWSKFGRIVGLSNLNKK